jgi:hypothetical protein
VAWVGFRCCLGRAAYSRTTEVIIPPITVVTKLKMANRIIKAGMDASAHFTIIRTIEIKGICRSTTMTWRGSSG